MKKLLINSIIIISILLYFYFDNSHHNCNWEECPADIRCEEFSSLWYIKQIHIESPKKSYEECEYILSLYYKNKN
jgi:hypothetical protein